MDPTFLIRDARPDDLGALFPLARLLDSYNLPADRRRLAALIRDSQAAFAGRPASRDRERYLFVLEDRSRRRVVGSSLVIARHGSPRLPHLFLNVYTERRRSRTLRRSVDHRCLRLGWTVDGPTELGGLVLQPDYRGHRQKLGHWLSYVRLLFIAARRKRFRPRLLAEYLPIFLDGGESPFWDYFGRKFTGLPYKTADRLSIDNKEFIRALFPHTPLYTDLFPSNVLAYLGRVGDPTKPAARLLEKMGFRYVGQIEPFDGGPYFEADTDRVPLVRRARRAPVDPVLSAGGRPHLLLRDSPFGVRAIVGNAHRRNGRWLVDPKDVGLLELAAGDALWASPFSR